MVVNPAGPQPIFDGTNPSIITARATIGVTGGQLVYLSGTQNSLSSGANSYATNDIVLGGAASGLLFNGIVITPGTTASGTNNYVAVAQGGTWILTAAGTLLAGEGAYPNGDDAVVAKTAGGPGSYVPIGRTITPAGSEGYTAVRFF